MRNAKFDDDEPTVEVVTRTTARSKMLFFAAPYAVANRLRRAAGQSGK